MIIKFPDWVDHETLVLLFDILGKDQTRFVGGVVRNILMKAGETDIDLSTIHLPEVVMEKCQHNNLKVIPTGLDHGTVTVVLKDRNIEITTLRKDIETDGRHARIAYTDNWLEDAKRRDFTVNALYLSINGELFDPLKCGLKDIEKRDIRFIGDPAQRIAEDYLRILRFFRFNAKLKKIDMDKAGLKACAAAADKIKTLSRERITQEFLKIVATDLAPDILKVMFDHKILFDLAHQAYDQAILSRLIAFQAQTNKPGALSRIFVLGGNRPQFFEDYLRLSHDQKKFLIKMEMAINADFYQNEKALKKAIFHHGNAVLVQGYLLFCAIHNIQLNNALFDTLTEWKAPECPITGDQLIKEGYQTGPELGQELTRRIDEWLEKVF